MHFQNVLGHLRGVPGIAPLGDRVQPLVNGHPDVRGAGETGGKLKGASAAGSDLGAVHGFGGVVVEADSPL